MSVLRGETVKAPGLPSAHAPQRVATPRAHGESRAWTVVERRQPSRQERTQSGVRALERTFLVTLVALEIAWLALLAYAAHRVVW
jgi:hypothetical protein